MYAGYNRFGPTKTETDANVKLIDKSDDSSKFDHFKSNLGCLHPQYILGGHSDLHGLSVYACGWP